MDQESQDLADAYSAGFQDGVEACADYVEKMADGDTTSISSLLYINIANWIRENVKWC